MSVLDSSAMLAYLNGERGGQYVQAMIEDYETVLYAHAINLCEVFYDFLGDKGRAGAEQAIATLKADGIIERNDLDGDFWRDIATLISARRKQQPLPERPKSIPRLALGDACGLALANRLGTQFITADRAEIAPLQNDGLVKAIFIR